MTPLGTRPLRSNRPAASPAEANGARRPQGSDGPSARTGRRNLPMVALGVLLVVGCALGFSSAWLRAGGRQQVLALSTNVSAGQILSATDLRTTSLSVGSGLAPVLAGQSSEVVGQTVAVPLAAGSLLTQADLGPSSTPPDGKAVVGLALKPGQYPPSIVPGSQVLVVTSDSADSSGMDTSASAGVPVPALVVGVEAAPADTSDTALVSIQMAEGDASAVASAGNAGDVTLVIVSDRSP